MSKCDVCNRKLQQETKMAQSIMDLQTSFRSLKTSLNETLKKNNFENINFSNICRNCLNKTVTGINIGQAVEQERKNKKNRGKKRIRKENGEENGEENGVQEVLKKAKINLVTQHNCNECWDIIANKGPDYLASLTIPALNRLLDLCSECKEQVYVTAKPKYSSLNKEIKKVLGCKRCQKVKEIDQTQIEKMNIQQLVDLYTHCDSCGPTSQTEKEQLGKYIFSREPDCFSCFKFDFGELDERIIDEMTQDEKSQFEAKLDKASKSCQKCTAINNIESKQYIANIKNYLAENP